LAMDLKMADLPIKVSCVCPDLIATPMMDHQVTCGEHSRLVFSGKKPLTADEVAQVILGEVWEQQPMEVAIPKVKGWNIRLMGLNPEISLWLSRQIEKKGVKNLNRFRAQDG
jgi:3-oxoacyl-[acyl-carrier protein] reductase